MIFSFDIFGCCPALLLCVGGGRVIVTLTKLALYLSSHGGTLMYVFFCFADRLSISYCRSSSPGGQNVNKGTSPAVFWEWGVRGNSAFTFLWNKGFSAAAHTPPAYNNPFEPSECSRLSGAHCRLLRLGLAFEGKQREVQHELAACLSPQRTRFLCSVKPIPLSFQSPVKFVKNPGHFYTISLVLSQKD